jgi:hypothetical protein
MHRECGFRANTMEELAASSRLQFSPEQLRLLKEAEEANKIAVGFVSIGVILVSIPTGIWSAFVALKLWRWFAEPLGAPHVGMISVLGLGLGLLIGLLRTSPLKSTSVEYEERVKKNPGKFFKGYCYAAVAYPAIALVIGYIYTLFQ